MTDYLFSAFGVPAVRVRDILDIVIVAVVIYRAILLIKGTLATQMILAVGFLFALFKVSEPQYLDLRTLHWILRNFWSIALIGVIILFQPEIRRGLVQIGQRRFFPRAKRHFERTIEEIVKAAEVFSTSHTGALIVIERKTGLEPIREMGKSIDSIITSELLRSIFFPHSPLHDGAVIIRNNRIAAAGCFLPLSKNPYLPSSYGTRHRAALGVTEETDALVVVVSEETGKISIAFDGQMQKQQTTADLKKRLLEFYRSET